MTAATTGDLLELRRLALELLERLEWTEAAVRQRGDLWPLTVLRANQTEVGSVAASLARVIAAGGAEGQ